MNDYYTYRRNRGRICYSNDSSCDGDYEKNFTYDIFKWASKFEYGKVSDDQKWLRIVPYDKDVDLDDTVKTWKNCYLTGVIGSFGKLMVMKYYPSENYLSMVPLQKHECQSYGIPEDVWTIHEAKTTEIHQKKWWTHCRMICRMVDWLLVRTYDQCVPYFVQFTDVCQISDFYDIRTPYLKDDNGCLNWCALILSQIDTQYDRDSYTNGHTVALKGITQDIEYSIGFGQSELICNGSDYAYMARNLYWHFCAYRQQDD